MAFSFGAPAAPKPAASTFSFGAPAASSSTSTPSLFGSAPAPASSAPSLFGSTPAPATSTPGTSLFGATSTAAPAGGLFGSTPAAAGGGPSLFGGAAKPATTTSLFGGATSQPASTPSLFGTSQPSSTPSLFGGAQSQAPATTSLFGQPQQPGTSSLFGQPQQQQQQQQPQQPAVTSAPLFGQSQSAATASLFGSKPASSIAQPTTTSLSLFGSSTTAAPSSSQFGLSQPQPAPGPGGSSGLSQSVAAVRKLGDPAPENPNEPSIEQRIESIKASYDPQHPKCRFQTYFYNEPAAGQSVSQYARPPNGTDDKAWSKAVKENPDPDHLVPAIAIGFAALEKRIESQSRATAQHQQLLESVHSHLAELASTHSLTTSLRTLRAQHASLALLARVTHLVARASALSPARNASLKRDEEDLRIALEGIAREVERVRNKSHELWTGVGQMRSRKKELDGLEWHVADEQGFNQILEVLTSQQRGLDHLTKTLEAMTGDTDVINEAFGRPLVNRRTAAEAAAAGGGGARGDASALSGSVAKR
ncbi:hypothetical protein JCM11491_007046 [Sporobolomyces phaffii]